MDRKTFINLKLDFTQEDVNVLLANRDAIKDCVLHNCVTNDKIMAQLCTFLLGNSALESLELRDCKFTANQIHKLFIALEYTLSLDFLFIQTDEEDLYTEALIPYLSRNKGSVTRITLMNSMTRANFEKLLAALAQNTTLSSINFGSVTDDNRYDINTAINEMLAVNTTLSQLHGSLDYTMTPEQQTDRFFKLNNNRIRQQSLMVMLYQQMQIAERREAIRKRQRYDDFFFE